MHPSEQFLTALWGDELSELDRILLWTAPAKTSLYAATPAEAVRHVEHIGQRQNIYFGCGLVPHNMEQYKRAKEHEIRGIPGVWADIDVINPKAHNKQRLAPTIADAIDLAKSLQLLPTLIVMSGHGIQPWWLFKEPWLFESREDKNGLQDGGGAERGKAADMLRGWQGMLKDVAAARGWEHDATHDLSRVLRLPGTYNIKDPEDVREVTVAHWNDAQRYNPADFEGYILEHTKYEDFLMEKNIPDPQFVPRRGAPLPPAFEELLKDDARMRTTWTRKRKDMKDASHSGWDMSIAGLMASYGDVFTDQDIADVLSSYRDSHCAHGSKEWKKGADKSYLTRTIKRARVQRFVEVRASEAIESVLDEGAPTEEITVEASEIESLTGEPVDGETVTVTVRTGKADLTHEQRAKKLFALSTSLGVKITAVRRYLSEPPQFEIIIAGQNVRVGDINGIIGQTEFRKAVAGATKVVIPTKKSDRWNKDCQVLLDCAEDIDVGDEGTEEGMVRAWLAQYMEENRPVRDIEGACRMRSPFIASFQGEEWVHVSTGGLRDWLLLRQEHYKERELAVMLRRYGCPYRRYNIKFTDSDTPTTRGMYLLPV